MEKPKLLRRSQRREFFGHHMLLHAAELQLREAAQSEAGRFNCCLGAMVMTSLAVEALVNAVGSRVIDDWHSFERLKPQEKLERLQEQLLFVHEPTKKPWTVLRYLAGFRNDIAHAKPQAVEETKRFTESAAGKFMFQTPLSTLEKEITLGNAKRSLEAVQALKGIFTDALPVELRFGIYADAWSHSTSSAG